MGKKKQSSRNTSGNTPNNQTPLSINLLTHLKSYKEAYALIGVFFSAILTVVWNLICGAGYLGYYSYWGIPSKYYINDNQNVLITFLVISGFIILISMPVYQYAKWSLKYKHGRKITFIIGTVVAVLPFPLFYIFKIEVPSLWFYLSVLIILIILLFMLVYFAITSLLIDASHHNESENNAEQTTNTSTVKVNAKSIAKFALSLIIAIISFISAAFFESHFVASSKTEFEFIVSDYKFDLEATYEYEVILSETNDVYYLSKCNILKEHINGIETIKLIVYPDFYSIVKKEEKNTIIRKNFDYVLKQ